MSSPTTVPLQLCRVMQEADRNSDEIPNDLTSRLVMKQVALGRKAWLCVSNPTWGERSARMMKLVSSARRHDIDSRAYLEDILTQLLECSTEYESLLPDAWKRLHPEAVRVYRQEERRDKADRKQLNAARRRLLKAQPRS